MPFHRHKPCIGPRDTSQNACMPLCLGRYAVNAVDFDAFDFSDIHYTSPRHSRRRANHFLYSLHSMQNCMLCCTVIFYCIRPRPDELTYNSLNLFDFDHPSGSPARDFRLSPASSSRFYFQRALFNFIRTAAVRFFAVRTVYPKDFLPVLHQAPVHAYRSWWCVRRAPEGARRNVAG